MPGTPRRRRRRNTRHPAASGCLLQLLALTGFLGPVAVVAATIDLVWYSTVGPWLDGQTSAVHLLAGLGTGSLFALPVVALTVSTRRWVFWPVVLWLWFAFGSLTITWAPARRQGRSDGQVLFAHQTGLFIPASLIAFLVLLAFGVWRATAPAVTSP